jgi:putative transposase
MTRPIRVEFPGAVYHVMSRGVDGVPTFRDQMDWNLYLGRLEKLSKLGLLVVHAFCLMTNHFHLLCETPIGMLSRWMQQLLSRYSGSFNRRHERVGHLWQARYKAILVEEGDYFLECSAYIHLNPVKAGLVQVPEEYRWSSYGTYIGIAHPYEWVSTRKTLLAFSNVQEYRRFVESKLKGEVGDPFRKAVAGIAFGSDAFARAICARVKQRGNQRDISGLTGLLGPVPIAVEQVCEYIRTSCSRLSSCQRERVLVYALRRFSGLTGRQIAALTGRSPQSITEVWKTFEEKQNGNGKMKQVIDLLERAMQDASGAC